MSVASVNDEDDDASVDNNMKKRISRTNSGFQRSQSKHARGSVYTILGQSNN